MEMTSISDRGIADQRSLWVKRAGLAGLTVFLVKGLLWLVVPLLWWASQ